VTGLGRSRRRETTWLNQRYDAVARGSVIGRHLQEHTRRKWQIPELRWSRRETRRRKNGRKGNRPCPGPHCKRKGFSDRQVKLISDYFVDHIADRKYPTSQKCQDFLYLYPTQFPDRTRKDIYNKCRNIGGR
jgi:hypothetical protein